VSSGTKGDVAFNSDAVPFNGKARSYRSWSGSDGKYEVVGGSVRSRWNTYTCETASQFASYGNLRWRCSKPGGGTDTTVDYSGFIHSYRPIDGAFWPVIDSNDVLKAQNKLLSRLKEHSFDLGVNLAQMGQVSGMVSSTLGKLGRSIMAVKRGDFTTAARQLGASPRTSTLKGGDVSGRWLELQYGWLPLLSDTFEAAKAFESISNGPRSSVIRGGKVRKTMKAFYVTGDDHFTRQHQRTFRYSYEMYEEMSVPRQLGLYDPLSVVWELIPYSFVVDWFVPIGTYLDNLNQIPTLTGRWLVHSGYEASGPIAWKRITPYPPCGYHGGAHRYDGVDPPIGGGSYKWVSRGPLGSPPKVPSPNFKFGGAVHGTRIWNAIALASQRFLS
jgi:hypothetical protein